MTLAAQLELALPELLLLTERDGQRLEAETGQRYSVDVSDGRGRSAKRWPDLMVEAARGNIAIEIEFSPKGSSRLSAILRAYLASDLSEVTLVGPRRSQLTARRWRTARQRRPTT